MAAFGPSSEGEITRHPIFGSSWTNGVWASYPMTLLVLSVNPRRLCPKAEAIRASYLARSDRIRGRTPATDIQPINRIIIPKAALALAFGLQNDFPMRRKSKPRSSSTKLSRGRGHRDGAANPSASPGNRHLSNRAGRSPRPVLSADAKIRKGHQPDRRGAAPANC